MQRKLLIDNFGQQRQCKRHLSLDFHKVGELGVVCILKSSDRHRVLLNHNVHLNFLKDVVGDTLLRVVFLHCIFIKRELKRLSIQLV